MLTAEGQHFICPLNMGYVPYQRVILAFRGMFLPEKRVLQDMICCPSAVNKCPFKGMVRNVLYLVISYAVPLECNVWLLILSLWALFCLTKHGGNHASRWIRDLWSKGISLILAYLQTFLSFVVLYYFFRFSFLFLFLCILGPPYYGIGATIRIGQEI